MDYPRQLCGGWDWVQSWCGCFSVLCIDVLMPAAFLLSIPPCLLQMVFLALGVLSSHLIVARPAAAARASMGRSTAVAAAAAGVEALAALSWRPPPVGDIAPGRAPAAARAATATGEGTSCDQIGWLSSAWPLAAAALPAYRSGAICLRMGAVPAAGRRRSPSAGWHTCRPCLDAT